MIKGVLVTLASSAADIFNLFVDIGKCKKWLPEQDSNLRQID